MKVTEVHKKTKQDTSKELIINAKIFAAFMGIYLSEGYCKSDSWDIIICQKNKWSKEYIKKEILEKFPEEIQWLETCNGFRLADARLHQYLSILGDSYNKYIPKEIKELDSNCLKELIFWFCIGDGRLGFSKNKKDIVKDDKTIKETIAKEFRAGKVRKNIVYQIFSTSKTLISDLHECLVLSGGSGSLTVIETTEDYMFADHIIKAENKVPLHLLTISSTNNIWLCHRTNINKFHHEGNIYCLTTTHGNFYMEQNGKAFWTGNCDGTPTVELKNVSHVVTSLKFSGKDVIGEAIVFDDPGPSGTPCGRLLGALIRNNCTVGISSRGYGATSEGYEGTIVDEYKLVTFDCVHNPSTQKAFVQLVNEGKDFKLQLEKALERERYINELKSEISSLFSTKLK